MNIFKNYTFKWWQVSILKGSVVCIGIAIGANWPQVFARYTTLLIVIALTLGLYLTFVSLKK